MRPTIFSILAFICLAGLAFAHSGVKDPLVMSRMNLMSDVSKAMKSLTQMANGEREYTAEIASKLSAELEKHASAIPGKFEVFATDPKTEALDAIWEEWDAFLRISTQMEEASKALSTPNLSLVEFRKGLVELGKTCLDCHQAFRKKQ